MKYGPQIIEANGLKLWINIQGQGPLCFLPSPGWGLSVDEYLAKRYDGRWDEIPTDEEFTEALIETLPLYFHDQKKLKDSLQKFKAGTGSIHPWIGWKDSEKRSVHILDRIAKIKSPTFILVGDDDFVCSEMNSNRIHEKIKGSKTAVLKNAGHFPWVEQPGPFFRELESFLRSQG